jgi:hypothetical protein
VRGEDESRAKQHNIAEAGIVLNQSKAAVTAPPPLNMNVLNT